MFSVFGHHTLSLKRRLLSAALLLLACACAEANTNSHLSPIPTQTIFPEQSFSYPLVLQNDATTAVQVRVLNAPPGLTLSNNVDGSYELSWTPPSNVELETIVIVQALDASNPSSISTQRLVLRRGSLELDRIEPVQHSNQAGLPMTLTADTASVALEINDTQADPQSPVLSGISAQLLQADKEFQLFIRPKTHKSTTVSLSAEKMPVGAELEEVFSGSWLLSWQPSIDQLGKHRIELIAIDESDTTLHTKQELVLTVVSDLADGDLPSAELSTEELTEIDEAIEEELVSGNDLLELNEQSGNDLSVLTEDEFSVGVDELTIAPLSAQIVSAGRIVQFKVIPETLGTAVAILHIDRLPRGASFDESPDGSRTFHWPTTSADQGQHIFRFTAIHPDDVNIRVQREVLIVIGNPDARQTLPEKISENIQPPKRNTILEQKVAAMNDPHYQDEALEEAYFEEEMFDDPQFEQELFDTE